MMFQHSPAENDVQHTVLVHCMVVDKLFLVL